MPRLYFFVRRRNASAGERTRQYCYATPGMRSALIRADWHPITRDRFYREAPADAVSAMLQAERGRPTQT